MLISLRLCLYSDLFSFFLFEVKKGSQSIALLLREFDFATMGVGKSFVVYSCRFYLAGTEIFNATLSLAVYVYD